MKIKKHIKKINRPTLIVASILLVGLVAFLVYAFFFKPQNDKPLDTNVPKETSSDQQQPGNPQVDTDDKTNPPNTDVPPTPTTIPESNKQQVQMVISAEQSNNTVFIRGGVNYPVTGGSCYAQLRGPSGQSLKKESVVLSNPASADCKTIAIPMNELTSGTWTVTLHYTSNEYEGASVEISFTL